MLWRFLKTSKRASSDAVRLFLSSTFRDMLAERDHLVTSVYPELEERLAELDLSFFDVDLRWGVPRPETAQIEEPLNSWSYCRRSIDQTEPFFVGLLGHRYGSIASKEHLTESERRRWGEARSITELEIRYAALDDKPPKRRSFFYFRSEPPDDRRGAPLARPCTGRPWPVAGRDRTGPGRAEATGVRCAARTTL